MTKPAIANALPLSISGLNVAIPIIPKTVAAIPQGRPATKIPTIASKKLIIEHVLFFLVL